MSRSGTRSVLRVVMLTLNAVAAAGVLAAYLAGIVSPATFWPLAFAGLAYPILLLIIILFALFWGIKGDWKLLLAHILLIALRFDLLADYYQFPSEKKPQDTEAINVMSYNVRLFDFYNFSFNWQLRWIFQYFHGSIDHVYTINHSWRRSYQTQIKLSFQTLLNNLHVK